jgi:hypothetical protein
MRLLVLLALLVGSAWLPGGASAAPQPAPAAAPGRITAQFDGVPLRQVLARLFQRSQFRYVLGADVPDVAITARLKDLDLEAALRIVTQLAGATYTRAGDRYLIAPLRLSAAATASRPGPAAGRAVGMAEPRFDLQLRDVPLRVALDQVFRGTGRQLAVEAQVPDVPITLNMRAVDFTTALGTLTRLAGAVYRKEGDGAGVYVVSLREPETPTPGFAGTVPPSQRAPVQRPGPNRAVPDVAAPAEKPLSLDLRQLPFRKAVEQLFQLSGREYALSPDTPNALISLRLRDVDFATALETLLRLAGVTYRQEGRLYVIGPGTGDARGAPAAEPAPAPDAADPAEIRIDLSLDRVPLRLALETLFAQVKVKYELARNVENVPISINLRDVDLASALRVLTRLADATYEKVGDTYKIRGRSR